MRRATVLSTCALMIVLLCCVVVAAQAPPPPPPPPPPVPHVFADGTMLPSAKVTHAIGLVQEYLELTDAQVQQWKDLQVARRDQAEQSAERIRELEQQLESQLSATNPNASAVGELVIQLRTVRQERTNAWKSFAEAVRQILTPAQIEKLNSADKASELRQVIGALVSAGFLAAPPPPPPPPLPPHAPKVERVPHAPHAPQTPSPHYEDNY